jgi:hypothetical protein
MAARHSTSPSRPWFIHHSHFLTSVGVEEYGDGLWCPGETAAGHHYLSPYSALHTFRS